MGVGVVVAILCEIDRVECLDHMPVCNDAPKPSCSDRQPHTSPLTFSNTPTI